MTTSDTSNKAGTLVLSIATPYVHSVCVTKRSSLCNQCMLPSNSLTRCTACNKAYYCSDTCQRLAKGLHSVECRLTQHFGDIPEDFLIFIKLCIRWRRGDAQQIKDEAGLFTFSQVKANVDNVQKNKDLMEFFTELMSFLHSMPIMKMVMVIPSHYEALEIFAQMVNSWREITDDDMRSIGRGIYLSASALQHSCDPNGTVLFRASKLMLFLNRDVTFPKEAVKISDKLRFVQVTFALPEHLIKAERLDILQKRFGILCSCESCSAHGKSYTELECFCPSGLCNGGIVQPQSTEMQQLKCDKCGWLSKSDCIVISHQLKKAVAARVNYVVQMMEERRTNDSYAILKESLLDFRLATSRNILRASLLTLAITEGNSMYGVDEALYYHNLLLPFHLHGNTTSFSLGLCYYAMGDILNKVGSNQQGSVLYRKAHAILSLYWSEAHPKIRFMNTFLNSA